jgi:hypothetical protein
MVYLCGEYNLVKSAPDALREMEVRVVTVGRCQEVASLKKCLTVLVMDSLYCTIQVASLKKCLNTGGGKQWKGVAHLVEVSAVIQFSTIVDSTVNSSTVQ